MLAGGDLMGWRGLPADLTLAEVVSFFPRDSDWSGTAQLGRRHHETAYLWVNIPSFDGKLRVWFEGERVVLLDLECSTPQLRFDQLKNVFTGSPAYLDTWAGTVPMLRSELVFSRQGIAAFTNSESNSIWHLAFFPSVSLDTYVNDLRIDMKVSRHQRRRI